MKQNVNGTMVEHGTKEWHEIGGQTREVIQTLLKEKKEEFSKSIKAGRGFIKAKKISSSSHSHDHITVHIEKKVENEISKNYFVQVPKSIHKRFA